MRTRKHPGDIRNRKALWLDALGVKHRVSIHHTALGRLVVAGEASSVSHQGFGFAWDDAAGMHIRPFSPRTDPAARGQVDIRPSGMDPQNRPIDSGNPLLTDPEACERLRCRQRQLYTYRMQGVIPFIRIGRSIRYRLRDLEAAIDAMTVVSLADATRKSGNAIGQPPAEMPAPAPNSNEEGSHEKH